MWIDKTISIGNNREHNIRNTRHISSTEDCVRAFERYLYSTDINIAFLAEIFENVLRVCDINYLASTLLSFAPKGDDLVFTVLLRFLLKIARIKHLETNILTQLISLMLTVSSAKVLSQALAVCMHSDLNCVDVSLLSSFLSRTLSSSSALVKIYALKLISSTPSLLSTSGLYSKVASLIHDQDPRIRAEALRYMHSFYSNSNSEFQISFDLLKTVLTDDYEEVRLAVLPLLLLLSQRCGQQEVNDVKLVDSVFCLLCDSINDSEMSIRANAVGMLGKMRGVKLQYLLQTLDKKFLVYQGTNSSTMSGCKVLSGWMFDESTKHDIELKDDDTNPMSMSACGAFIHALEDEFIEVRRPAINSLCALAASHEKEFAMAAIDFVVDMFNDEIEDIRVYAMTGLVSIVNSSEVLISDDQAEIMISALEDFSSEVRESMRTVLANLHAETRTGLRTILNGLLTNIRRYSSDAYYVWSCAKLLGQNHPHLGQFLINDLFTIHPFFDTPEPDMEDPSYITVLIFILNSADCHAEIFSLLPTYARRHYDFLKIKEPDLIPDLVPKAGAQITSGELNLLEFLDIILKNCEVAENLKHQYFMQLYKSNKSDLEHLKSMDSLHRGLAEFYLLQCDLRLLARNRFKRMFNFERSLELCRKMLLAFLHHSDEDIKQICLLQFYFDLCCVLKELSTSKTNETALIERINMHSRWLSKFSFGNVFNTNQRWNLEKIEEFTTNFIPSFFRVSKNLKLIKLDLVEPTENADNPLKFTAGLLAAVKLVIITENLNTTNNLRIKVFYPDDTIHLIPISDSCLKPYYSSKSKIEKTVLLSHNEWSEASCVEISVGFIPDNIICFSDSPNDHYVPLSRSVKYYIFPHAFKR